ncbi:MULTISPECIES: hypothetical protein [Nguyenibacter]|uniref:Transglycosylase SLT domain-containing protein n=1 Tax=Nguyenibacter vanlangensis TaxID=1216886 RepID=A0ABZ3DBC0_9PROT|nr:hypothetical protein [Nguyenibacter sp. L1]WRH89465.1 hypothetical protein QN315_07705 [Nguyenibacter sp. L1]
MGGLDAADLKWRVVAPTLDRLGLGGPAAVNLLTGTALVESRAARLVQEGGGPALGLWQMEPATHDALWRMLTDDAAHAELETRLRRMTCSDIPRMRQLIGNLRYACAMARVKYRFDPGPLPDAKSAENLCAYWKRVYNTALGAGVVDSVHVAAFATAIAA